jgi:lysophospholipase L1-like esterase
VPTEEPVKDKAPSWRRRWARRLAKFGLVVFLILLALEIVLRVVGHSYQSRQLEALARRREASWKPVTILTLGESTTGGLWLPFEQSYPKQLEQRLRERYGQNNLEVLVPPHSGQNTSQMVHRFAGYLRDFEPALVIFMCGVNNTWSLAESNLGDFLPKGDPRTYLFKLRRITDDIKVVRMFRLASSSTGEAWNRMQQDMEGAPMMTQWPPKPDLFTRGVGEQPFVELWRSDLGRMIEQSQAAGVPVILMTYPNYDTPTVPEFEGMAAKYSVPLIRNHESFAPYLQNGRALEVFFDDLRHPNAAGYGIVVDNLMRLIDEQKMLAKVFPEPAAEQPAPEASP